MTRSILFANTLLILAPLLHWVMLLTLPPGANSDIRLLSVMVILLCLVPAIFIDQKPGSMKRYPLFWILALIILTVALILYSRMVWIRPMGMWDAWSQWNLKARDYSLSFLQGYDFILTRPEWFNAQYPPAYPMLISFWTVLLGEWSQAIPIAVNAVLYALPAGLLLTLESGRTLGRTLLGLTVLMAVLLVPQIWLNATNLCADTYLATVLLLSIYWGYRARQPVRSRSALHHAAKSRSNWMLFYAFSNAGFLLLVKPEGMILAPFALGTIILMNGRRMLRASPLAWTPLLLMALLFFVFKAYAVERVHYEVHLADTLQRLTSWDRYERLVRHFVALNILSSGSILFVFLGLALRRHWKQTLKWCSPLLLALACYHGIFLITPIDQEMHLLQAYARITMHVYPTLLFLLYLVIGGGRLWRPGIRAFG